jgi:hypothetical protein
MGWSLSPYHFCVFTDTFVRHLRQPDPGGFTTHQGRPTQPDSDRPSERFLRHTRWRGAKILPYVDDFLLFAATRALALALRQRVDRLLTSLGLLRHPSKDFWEPTRYGHHLGIDIDTTTCYFFAPSQKLHKLAKQARQLLHRATRANRWLHVKELQSFAGNAQYLYLAIPAARFFLRTWRQVGRPSPPLPSAPSRSTMVDTCTQPRNWQKHAPPSRVSVHTVRQFGVWLGGQY